LAREIEIAIVDGQRLFGNGFCIPAGPLREPLSRLQSVNYVVINGEPAETVKELTSAAIMHLQPNYLVNLISGERRPFGGAPFNIGNRIQAVTGIGNPGRFHTLLAKLPYEIEPIEFPDHHQFKEGDFEKWGVDKIQPVVMTEKDAVKCRRFARPNFWYLSTELKLSDEFSNQLGKEIQKLAAR
jgi:tetraacyldisaccharide 4'-kinase